MFGQQVCMPIDILYGSPLPHTTTVPQYVADLCSSLRTAYDHVGKRMAHRLDRQKELYDKKAHGKPFEPGDLVWLHTPHVANPRSCIACGLVPIELYPNSLMLCTAFNTCRYDGSALWYTSTGSSPALRTSDCQNQVTANGGITTPSHQMYPQVWLWN